jgi:DNA-binding transcriptional MerR regulator
MPHPIERYYRIGDVGRLLNESTVTVRWWQEEFGAFLRVMRSGSEQRVYSSRALETLREIQRLLRIEMYTAAGAKRQLRLAAERQKGTG